MVFSLRESNAAYKREAEKLEWRESAQFDITYTEDWQSTGAGRMGKISALSSVRRALVAACSSNPVAESGRNSAGAAAVVSRPPGAAVPHSAAPPQRLTTATTARAAGCAQCVRAPDPFCQWRDEKCHQREGAGVGADLQEVRRAGHRSAADLVPASWVFVEVRERTHDIGRLWLGWCVAVADWSGACRKKVVLPARRRWLKEHGVRWDAGD